ncbi:hypothetical protein DFAR_2230002 [Desulfarculales bacterium]
MNLTPTAQEKAQLEEVWRDQAPSQAQLLDLTRPVLCRQQMLADETQVAQVLATLLSWTQWVQLYAKPSLAVVAASKLARLQGWPAECSGPPRASGAF